MTQKTIQNLKSSILTFALVLGVSYASAAWTVPPATPPNGNVSAPINVGGKDGTDPTKWYSQFKTGLITLDHLITGDLTVTNSDGTVSGIIAGSGVTISPAGGTGAVTVNATGGTSISTIRSSIEYVSCTGSANTGVNPTCTATCPTGKKVIAGSCFSINGGNSANVILKDEPDASGSGWVCTGRATVASNNSASVSLSASCL